MYIIKIDRWQIAMDRVSFLGPIGPEFQLTGGGSTVLRFHPFPGNNSWIENFITLGKTQDLITC